MSIYLGIDIGTSGTKTLAMKVGSLAMKAGGQVLAEASATYPCHHPRPLWSEQNPDDWWRATVKTVRQVMKRAKLRPADVKGIGLSGQMHGSVFLDKNDQVVRPALLWNDQRTMAECQEIEQRVGGRKRLVKLVANPALTGFTAPKILWLRNNEPKNFDRTVRILLPKDDIRRRLTGEFATDASDASGTLLFNVVKRQWSKPMLQKLELDSSLLPTVHESDDITGQLTTAAAKQLGLTTDCVVVGGAGDCAAGALAGGIVQRGIVSTSLGTSGVVFAHSDTPEVDPEGRLHTFCHAVRDKWHMMGVTLSAAGSLDWFVQSLCQTDAKLARQKKQDIYSQLTAEAAATPAGAEGLFFLPYLSGERAPHADPLARGAFIGLTLAHTRGHMVRAVLEGVTYSLRDCLEIVEGLGVKANSIRTTGGGAKSPFWRQLQADLLGKKVAALANDAGASFGVALLAAVGCGEYKNIAEACKQSVRTADECKPHLATRRYYNRAMPQYQQLYQSLQGNFREIAQL